MGDVVLWEGGELVVYCIIGGKFGMGIDFWLNGVARMDRCSDDCIVFSFLFASPLHTAHNVTVAMQLLFRGETKLN